MRIKSDEKYIGEKVWKAENVGVSNSMVFDEENIYLSGYYGPNLVVVSKKDGKELYRNEEDTFGWVYDLELYEKEIVLHYEHPDEGGIKRIDISNYKNGEK